MTEPDGDFVAVCRLNELEPKRATHVLVAGKNVAVVVTDEGVFAIKDECSHAEVPLSEGEVEGCMIECWLHGSQFDLRTGRPLTLPATSSVPVYATRIIGSGDDCVIEVSTTPIVI
ncbi:MAG: non-heme iron oxygenase ferredoxin subunit [Candidatus Nanopelagicales bacterium]|nr:non-heme iron oxygenase ferredoxin subunit [Candidatus Nanopelagicales bacterium]